MIGERFGRLVVLSRWGSSRHGVLWLCRCDCGGEVVRRGTKLRAGFSKSCGCWRAQWPHNKGKIDQNAKSRHPLFQTWNNMMTRCYNPKCRKFTLWGGRGIKVCERWHTFENFVLDMPPRPPGMSIDRYPNQDGDYEPGNVRWATAVEQRANSRPRGRYKRRKDAGVKRGSYKENWKKIEANSP